MRESVAIRFDQLERPSGSIFTRIKGRESDGPATVGMLAERLHIKHHSAVELVDRLCARKLVARRRSPDDRRQVIVEMRPAGRAVLERLAIHSLAELRNVGPALIEVLARLIGKTASRRSAGAANGRAGAVRGRAGGPGPRGRGATGTLERRPTRNGGPP